MPGMVDGVENAKASGNKRRRRPTPMELKQRQKQRQKRNGSGERSNVKRHRPTSTFSSGKETLFAVGDIIGASSASSSSSSSRSGLAAAGRTKGKFVPLAMSRAKTKKSPFRLLGRTNVAPSSKDALSARGIKEKKTKTNKSGYASIISKAGKSMGRSNANHFAPALVAAGEECCEEDNGKEEDEAEVKYERISSFPASTTLYRSVIFRSTRSFGWSRSAYDLFTKHSDKRAYYAFPDSELSPPLLTSLATLSPSLLRERQKKWASAFSSLFWTMADSDDLPSYSQHYFYYFDKSTTIAFSKDAAFVSRSSRAFRHLLDSRGVKFTTPLDPSLKKRDGVDHEAERELRMYKDGAASLPVAAQMRLAASTPTCDFDASMTMVKCEGCTNVAGLHAALLDKWMGHIFASDTRGIVRDVPLLVSFRPFSCSFISRIDVGTPRAVAPGGTRAEVTYSLKMHGYLNADLLRTLVEDVAKRHARAHGVGMNASCAHGEVILDVALSADESMENFDERIAPKDIEVRFRAADSCTLYAEK